MSSSGISLNAAGKRKAQVLPNVAWHEKFAKKWWYRLGFTQVLQLLQETGCLLSGIPKENRAIKGDIGGK